MSRPSPLHFLRLPLVGMALFALFAVTTQAQEAPVSRPDAPVNGSNESRKFPLPELPEIADAIVRFPTISPDGKSMAFVFDGDIWTSDLSGENARRMTITEGNDSTPLFSPDGQWIAFRSMRYGGYDIFIMPADGGRARRLTYSDAHDYPSAWLPDSSGILFASARRNSAYDLHCVRIDGTEAWPITSGGYRQSEFYASISPNGKRIAYVHSGGMTSYRRRGYAGTTSNDIWVCDFDGRVTTNHRKVVGSAHHDSWPQFADNDHILYATFDGDDDHRVSRIAVVNLEGGDELVPEGSVAELRDVRDLSFTPSGLAFSTGAYGGWKTGVITDPSEEAHYPAFDLGSDRRTAGMMSVNHKSASEFAVSPNGKLLSFIAGGDIYLMPTASGGVPKRLTTTIERELQISFSPDSQSLLYSSQREGVTNLFTFDLLGSGERQLTESSDGASSAIYAKDGKTIYYVAGEKTIKQIDLEGKATAFAIKAPLHSTDRQSGATLSLSPKGRWLAFPGEDELGNSTIQVADLHDEAKVYTLTKRFGDCYQPRFSQDGKHLAFICNEVDDYDVYVADLQRAKVTFAEDKLEEAFKDPKKPAKAKVETPEKKTDKTINSQPIEEIDFVDLGKRTRRLTTHRGNELYPVIVGSKVYFFSNNGGSSTNLWSQPLKGGVAKQITSTTTRKSGLFPAPDFKSMWMSDNNRPTRVSAAGTGPKSYRINVTQRRSREAIRKGVIAEATWIMENYFYDPNMHGLEWKKITDHYAKAIPSVSTDDEFATLMNELFGELNSSHQRYYLTDKRSDGYTESVGALGLVFDDGQRADGHFLIKEVLKGGPCDHPDSKVKAGDYLVGINDTLFAKREGRPVILARLMLDTIGKKTVLHLASSPDAKASKTTAVKPIPSRNLNELFYQRWVDAQRAMVHKLSDGRLGYVHIRRQDGASLAHFMHHLGNDNIGKDGIVFDVRFNGGGYTAVHQLEVLHKKTWLIRRGRDSTRNVSENIYRSKALEKPSCLLINGSSFSNAEILAEGFRHLKIGPIIGKATGGGVIGTSSHNLVDGSRMRLPLSGAYAVNGENLENNGRKPDVDIDNTPEILNGGRDAQTAKAVEVLLTQLKK